MPTLSRRDRLVDLAALILIVVGAALCFISSGRLHEIGQLSYRHPGPRTESALAAADRARYVAYGGAGLIVVGLTTAAGSAMGVARRKRRGAS